MKNSNSLVKLLTALMVFCGLSLFANEALARNSYVGQPQQLSMGAFYGGHIGASATYILSSRNAVDAA
ncbi:MAG: hypothetical protein KDD43_11385, partial [Bdellovibrionales bacterium]|nr:hypothetical protein [Bdellovibrionales bacterium]